MVLTAFDLTAQSTSSRLSRRRDRPPATRPRRFDPRQLVGRLARGVSIDSARAELLARWPSVQSATLPFTLSEAEREALLRQRVNVVPLAGGFSGLRTQYGTTLWVLLALVGILLAVACANLAGLTLARSLARRHQVAIRLALGGRPRRVFWQLLVDGLLLSAVAFAAALPLAWGIIRAVTASLLFGRTSSKFLTLTPDAGVIAATALLTVCLGLAVGVVPAWQSVTVRVDASLRRGRGTIGSLGRFGRGLLIAQVAMSMTLLASAGLFAATLARLRANDTSLQSQRIVFTRAYREPGDRATLPLDYYRTLVTELARMPGADAAALSVYHPTYYAITGPLPAADYHYTQADGVTPLDATVLTDFVSPGFFDLFKLARLQGRDFSWDDGPGKPAVALISASLARALFPAGDAIGHHLRVAGPERRDVEVIGVVADAPYRQAGRPTAARRVPADSAGNGEGAVSNGVCPRERRRCDRARRIHASGEVAGASSSAARPEARMSIRVVPSATLERIWVSPRVNRAEPCTRGEMSTSHSIGRISSWARPSGASCRRRSPCGSCPSRSRRRRP